MKAGITVLVVEDIDVNRKLIEAFCKRLGCESVPAENGAQAVEAVQSQKFDLVFMDLHMPVMDGHEALKKIRELGHTLPIVALTAEDLSPPEEQGAFDAFLTKPVRLKQIEDILERFTK